MAYDIHFLHLLKIFFFENSDFVENALKVYFTVFAGNLETKCNNVISTTW